MNVQSLRPNKHAQVRHSPSNSQHIVQFYISDVSLLTPLCAYVRDSLVGGGSCIVIATQAHLEAVNRALKDADVDTLTLRMEGRYVALDAQRTLETFMVEGMPDWGRFVHTLGPVLQTAAAKGNRLYAYGEMVALLWKGGHKEAVICLEEFWNRLLDEYAFSLYCAYPELHFVHDHPSQQKIRTCHTA